jgi:hypothetical protein
VQQENLETGSTNERLPIAPGNIRSFGCRVPLAFVVECRATTSWVAGGERYFASPPAVKAKTAKISRAMSPEEIAIVRLTSPGCHDGPESMCGGERSGFVREGDGYEK